MSRRLGELIERGSEALDPVARARMERWRSRADRNLAFWIAIVVLLPLSVYPATLLTLKIQSQALQALASLLTIVIFGFGFPAALLAVRDCWRWSARLSRDLVNGRVEIWSNGGGPVRRLPHTGWLVDEEGANRRRLEQQPLRDVADVPRSAFWIPIPPEEAAPDAPPLERRRFSPEEALEIRRHVRKRTRGLALFAMLFSMSVLQAVRLLVLQRDSAPSALGWIVALVSAWLGWSAVGMLRFLWKLRQDRHLGAVVAPADQHENEYLGASGIPWTVDGSPALWRL